MSPLCAFDPLVQFLGKHSLRVRHLVSKKDPYALYARPRPTIHWDGTMVNWPRQELRKLVENQHRPTLRCTSVKDLHQFMLWNFLLPLAMDSTSSKGLLHSDQLDDVEETTDASRPRVFFEQYKEIVAFKSTSMAFTLSLVNQSIHKWFNL